jgi:HAD superfamily phosphoserine phosphatase-like hydrolase
VGNKGLVLVDLDGTLIDAPGSERRFIAELMRKGYIGPAQWRTAAMFLLRNGARFGRDVARKNKGYLAGLGAERVAALGAEFVAQNLIHELRAFMLERLQQHLSAGDRIVLLTGAPDFLAAPLARHLGLADYSATICHRAGDRFTAQPPVQHPLGWDKRRLGAALCEQAGCVLEDCTAYADARHDLPLLDAVGQAVAVTPDRVLAQAAAVKGWEILMAGPLYSELGDSR